MKNLITLIIGLILILLGISFLLNIFHVFNFADYLLRLWPLLIVIWGLNYLTRGRFYWGLILIILGSLFIISNFGLVTFNVFLVFWPTLIILLGISVIIKAFRKDGSAYKSSTDGSFEVVENGKSLNEVNILSDKKVKLDNAEINGGSVVTVLGSTKLDITDTRSVKKGAILEVVNILGETTITVPDNINIKFDSTPILGSIDDQRKQTKEIKKGDTLLIKGVAVIGEIKIR